jgi:hypothetical protein
VSPRDEVTAGTDGGIRRGARTILAEPVELANLNRSWSTEATSTHNISSRGARVTTQRLWEPGSLVLLKSLRSDFWRGRGWSIGGPSQAADIVSD